MRNVKSHLARVTGIVIITYLIFTKIVIMKKIIPFSILIVALLLVNCSNKNANPKIKSEVNNKIASQILNFPKSGEDTLKVSYYADTVIYVPFETTPESLMDRIKQLWLNDSLIIVNCDKAGLLMFRIDGKFIRKIGKPGRGPGEYGLIFDFDVSRDTIYVSCSGRRGFLRYTFDGKFCDAILLKYQPAFFSTTSDQKLVCYDHHEGKLYVYNKGLQKPDTIIVEYGVTQGRYRWMHYETAQTYLQKSPSGLLFSDYISDTVWNITGNKKEPAYILNLNNRLPRDRNIEFSNGNFKGWDEMAKNYSFVQLFPLSSWMFIIQKAWGPSPSYEALYVNNIKTGEIKRYNKPFFYDDIASKQFLWTFFFPYSEDYLVAIGASGVIQTVARTEINPADLASPAFITQMKTVKDDDNPVIALIKLKKN
jgi:hypothetical protein